MLIGTYLHMGSYVTVGVELDSAERPHVVLERQDRPGEAVRRAALVCESFAGALRHAEVHLLARGGVFGAEAEGLAGSPVPRHLARAMFSATQMGRFVHVPSRRPPG